jgi:hypothetical protein
LALSITDEETAAMQYSKKQPVKRKLGDAIMTIQGKYGLILIAGCASLLVSCTNEVAPNLNCGELRKVRIGMSTDDVRRILGAPLDVVTASEMATREATAEFHPDLQWNYYRASEDVRLQRRNAWIEFREGRVGRVEAGAKYLWGRSWASYSLRASGVFESSDFKDRFCRD